MKKILDLIEKAENIVFFTGAGVSTNCGIPDFRGKNGLYSYVKEKYNLPYPEAIFDMNYFMKNPKPFFLLSSELLNARTEPSVTHKFISWLESKGKVSLVVTQNIDMLHQRSGSRRVIPCHGTYERARCIDCSKLYSFSDIEKDIYSGEIPECVCGGVIKPDITFFGESLPEEFYAAFEKPPAADLVIVMGTSLEVNPAAQFPMLYRNSCPLILVNNKETRYDKYFTSIYNMDCDKFSEVLWNDLKDN